MESSALRVLCIHGHIEQMKKPSIFTKAENQKLLEQNQNVLLFARPQTIKIVRRAIFKIERQGFFDRLSNRFLIGIREDFTNF
jgi:hypothetical protein